MRFILELTEQGPKSLPVPEQKTFCFSPTLELRNRELRQIHVRSIPACLDVSEVICVVT